MRSAVLNAELPLNSRLHILQVILLHNFVTVELFGGWSPLLFFFFTNLTYSRECAPYALHNDSNVRCIVFPCTLDARLHLPLYMDVSAGDTQEEGQLRSFSFSSLHFSMVHSTACPASLPPPLPDILHTLNNMWSMVTGEKSVLREV